MSNLWFDLRVEYHRMRRRLAWMRHPQPWAVERSASSAPYRHLLIERTSPLKRGSDGTITAFSEEKKQNLRIAAGRMNGLVIKPVAIEESDHRFFRRDGEVFRSNRLWRSVNWNDGRPATRDLLVTNECRVLYPADDLVDGDARGDA